MSQQMLCHELLTNLPSDTSDTSDMRIVLGLVLTILFVGGVCYVRIFAHACLRQ